MRSFRGRDRNSSEAGTALLTLSQLTSCQTAGIVIGAGAMFLLEPDRGPERRKKLLHLMGQFQNESFTRLGDEQPADYPPTTGV